MDVAQIVVEGAVALASGAAGALATAWKLSGRLTAVESEAKEARAEAKTAKAGLDAFIKEESTAWQQASYKLGKIQGALGIND